VRIAIMGAGAVGAYVGAHLAEAGEDVSFVARGAHLRAMQTEGLRFEGPSGNLQLPKVTATDDPAEIGPVDLVLFTVKLWDTEQASRGLAPLLSPETRVITLQNGIDSADVISRIVPRGRVAAGVIYISAVIAAPGLIRSPGGARRMIVDASAGDEIVARFISACGRTAALEPKSTETITTAIWEKFIALCAASGATSLIRATIGPILANPETRAFFQQLLEEGVAVARAKDIPVRSDLVESTMAFADTLPPTYRASMAEDLNHARRLELPWLSGRMHKLGSETRIPTPAHSAVYRGLLLHAKGGINQLRDGAAS